MRGSSFNFYPIENPHLEGGRIKLGCFIYAYSTGGLWYGLGSLDILNLPTLVVVEIGSWGHNAQGFKLACLLLQDAANRVLLRMKVTSLLG